MTEELTVSIVTLIGVLIALTRQWQIGHQTKEISRQVNHTGPGQPTLYELSITNRLKLDELDGKVERILVWKSQLPCDNPPDAPCFQIQALIERMKKEQEEPIIEEQEEKDN